jgi:membrane associated rhomboid family serine protease
MSTIAPESDAARALGSEPPRQGWVRTLPSRAPVASSLVALFFGGVLATAAVPSLAGTLALIPTQLSVPSQWYRLLTFPVVQSSVADWFVVGIFMMASGALAERWLQRGTIWSVAIISAVSSGLIVLLTGPTAVAVIGGGFVASGLAGAAVGATIRQRRQVSRGGQAVALVLLVLYTVSALNATPASLAMLASFVVGNCIALWRLAPVRSSLRQASGAA